MHDLDSYTGLTWTVLGAIGGAVKVMIQLLGSDKLPSKMSIFWIFVANIFVSAFSGFMGAILASNITPNDDIHIFVAGISGYMGVAALDMFSKTEFMTRALSKFKL